MAGQRHFFTESEQREIITTALHETRDSTPEGRIEEAIKELRRSELTLDELSIAAQEVGIHAEAIANAGERTLRIREHRKGRRARTIPLIGQIGIVVVVFLMMICVENYVRLAPFPKQTVENPTTVEQGAGSYSHTMPYATTTVFEINTPSNRANINNGFGSVETGAIDFDVKIENIANGDNHISLELDLADR